MLACNRAATICMEIDIYIFLSNIHVLRDKESVQRPYKYKYVVEGYGGQLSRPTNTKDLKEKQKSKLVLGPC